MTDCDDTDSEGGSLTPEEFVEVVGDDASNTRGGDKFAPRGDAEELDEFPLASDEQLLRVLAANPSKPSTHEAFAECTDLDSNSITSGLERLESQYLVDDRGGRYFIPESRQSTVDGLLIDTQQLRFFATESAQGRSISELDPRSADAHILTLIYNKPARSYSVAEIYEELEDTLDFTRDAIEVGISRLYDENRIRKTTGEQYQAIDSREDLRRFARNMESAKRMFERYSENNADSDDTKEKSAE